MYPLEEMDGGYPGPLCTIFATSHKSAITAELKGLKKKKSIVEKKLSSGEKLCTVSI